MNTDNTPVFVAQSQPLDAAQIEAEARRMRAEAMQQMLRGFGRWLRGLVAGAAARNGRTA